MIPDLGEGSQTIITLMMVKGLHLITERILCLLYWQVSSFLLVPPEKPEK